jgi:hypothetical protein
VVPPALCSPKGPHGTQDGPRRLPRASIADKSAGVVPNPRFRNWKNSSELDRRRGGLPRRLDRDPRLLQEPSPEGMGQRHLALQSQGRQLQADPVQQLRGRLRRWVAAHHQLSTLHISYSSRSMGLFAHTDLQYAPFIGTLEVVLEMELGSLLGPRLACNVAIQSNSCDCSCHVIFNSRLHPKLGFKF